MTKYVLLFCLSCCSLCVRCILSKSLFLCSVHRRKMADGMSCWWTLMILTNYVLFYLQLRLQPLNCC